MTYQSLHQPGGLAKSWTPGKTVLRVMSTNTNLRQFKMFIPPGAKSISLISHVGQSSGSVYYFAARFGKEPTGSPAPGSSAGFTLKELESGDCFGKNSSGYVRCTDSIGFTPLMVGGWLYVNLNVQRGNLIDTSGYVMVDAAAYKAWYATAKFGSDGDPVAGVVVPPPVPSVVDIVISQAQWAAVQAGARVNWVVR